jgi:thiamine biosynthesis protein ThiS
MNIILNGQEETILSGTTLTQLVATFAQDPRGVAIERNRQIVPKSTWDDIILVDNDRLEIVQFVGGGV